MKTETLGDYGITITSTEKKVDCTIYQKRGIDWAFIIEKGIDSHSFSFTAYMKLKSENPDKGERILKTTNKISLADLLVFVGAVSSLIDHSFPGGIMRYYVPWNIISRTENADVGHIIPFSCIIDEYHYDIIGRDYTIKGINNINVNKSFELELKDQSNNIQSFFNIAIRVDKLFLQAKDTGQDKLHHIIISKNMLQRFLYDVIGLVEVGNMPEFVDYFVGNSENIGYRQINYFLQMIIGIVERYNCELQYNPCEDLEHFRISARDVVQCIEENTRFIEDWGYKQLFQSSQ